MGVTYLEISYPNFVLGSIIDPEEANQNNYDIVTKINGIISAHNLSEENITNLGSDKASVIYVDEQNTNLAGAGRTIQTIKANFDAMVSHKASGDHDGKYYTRTLLDGGQLDNRYFTKGQLSPFMAGSTVPIYTDKFTITSSDNGNGTFTYLRGGVEKIGNILNGNTQVITIEGNTYRKDINGLMVYVDGVLFTSINGNELIELTDTTFGLKPIQPSDVIITIKYINKDGILAIDNVMQQLANIEATSLQLQDEISDSLDEVELMLDSKADIDVTGNVPVEQLENVRDMKDFYGREVQRLEAIGGANSFLLINPKDLVADKVDFGLISNLIQLYYTQSVSYQEPLGKEINGLDLKVVGQFSTGNTLSIVPDSHIQMQSGNASNSPYIALASTEPYDLTNVTSIEFEIYTTHASTMSRVRLGVRNTITDGIEDDVTFTGSHLLYTVNQGTSLSSPIKVSLDVTALTGLHYLKISTRDGNGSASSTSNLYLKNIKFIQPYESILPTVLNEGKLAIIGSLLEQSFQISIEMPSKFLDWYNLNAMVDTPPGTSVRFDIYDKYDNLLKADVKQGDILKLTEPVIKPKVTLSRDTLETPSPTFSWLEIGMRGVGDSTLLFGRDVKRYEASDIDSSDYNEIPNIDVFTGYDYADTPVYLEATDTRIFNTPFKMYKTVSNGARVILRSEYVELRAEINSSTFGLTVASDVPFDLTDVDEILLDISHSQGTLHVGVQKNITLNNPNFDVGETYSGSTPRKTIKLNTRGLVGEYYIKLYLGTISGVTGSSSLYSSIIFKYKDNVDNENGVLSLRDPIISQEINLPPTAIPPNFSEWHGLNALTDTPPGTKVRFDIYDKYGNLLEDDIKNGEKFKNFTYPEIYPRVTLSRDSLETPSPTFSWLEIGWLGSNAGMQVWKKIDEITLDVITVKLGINIPDNIQELRIIGRNIKGSTDLNLSLNNSNIGNSYIFTTIAYNAVTSLVYSGYLLGGGMSPTIECYLDIILKKNVDKVYIESLMQNSLTSVTNSIFKTYGYNSPSSGFESVELKPSVNFLPGATFEIWGRE